MKAARAWLSFTAASVLWSLRGGGVRFSPDPAADLAARRRSIGFFLLLHSAAVANAAWAAAAYGLLAAAVVTFGLAALFSWSLGSALSDYARVRRLRVEEMAREAMGQ